jgi:hypothetical protein|tara:strand:- start:1469 stop:1672 length:204 start_codon:yes stop_codon:yes gene_type:complete
MAEIWEKKQRFFSRHDGWKTTYRNMCMVPTEELKEWAFTSYKDSKNPKKRRKAIKELERRGMRFIYV